MKSGRQLFGCLFFVAIFGFFAWSIGLPAIRTLVLQHRAESFSMVQGTVLSGEVMTTHGSKGRAYYHPSFWYRYQVDGRTYTGRRYRYDGHPSFSDSTPAQQIVDARRIGSEIDVYYNPADPSESVLSTQVRGFDVDPLFLGLGMCLMILAFVVKSGREMFLRADSVAGGVKIISERMTTRVRLPDYDPSAWSAGTMCVLSFIAAMVMAASTGMGLIAGEWMVLFIVLAGAGVYFWLWRNIASGSKDLVIDEAARTVQLPLSFDRWERIQCTFSDVTGVSLEEVSHQGRYRVWYSYAPTLLIAGKPPQRLTDLNKERAESFAAWLREKLGLMAKADAGLVEK